MICCRESALADAMLSCKVVNEDIVIRGYIRLNDATISALVDPSSALPWNNGSGCFRLSEHFMTHYPDQIYWVRLDDFARQCRPD